MPFKSREVQIAYLKARRQRIKDMEQQHAFTLIRDCKKNYQRGISAGTTADELVDDFAHVYNGPTLAQELDKLPHELIPNVATDEVEAHFLTLTKAERMVEYEKLSQKLRFLETIQRNEDIKANQFIGDVLVAMDMKVKEKEAKKATLKTRQTLGQFKSAPAEASGGGQRSEPSIWNLFSSSSSNKRSRDDV
jgi:hypothetical protein